MSLLDQSMFFIIYSFLIISPFIDLEDNNSDESNSESLDEDDADEKRNVSEDLVEKLEEEILDKVFHFHLTLFCHFSQHNISKRIIFYQKDQLLNTFTKIIKL